MKPLVYSGLTKWFYLPVWAWLIIILFHSKERRRSNTP